LAKNVKLILICPNHYYCYFYLYVRISSTKWTHIKGCEISTSHAIY